MTDKTNEELRAALIAAELARQHNERFAAEREKSDGRYAVKMVERIVYGLITVVLVAVVGALMALVVGSRP